MSAAPQRQFSGWQLARESFAFVAANLGQALRVAGPWLVIVMLASYWYLIARLVLPDARFLLSGGATLSIVSAFVRLIVWALAYGVVAVAWHRLVLRGELALTTLLPSRAAALYLLLIAATYLVVWIVPYAGIFYLFSLTVRPGVVASVTPMTIVALAVALALLGLAMRFSLKFPAIALGDREMTLRRSWAKTATLWPALLWGTVVISVPTLLLTRFVSYAARYAYSYPAVVLFTALTTAIIFLSILVYATFLSLAYRATTEDVSATFA